MTRAYYLFVSAIAGAAVLALEVLAARAMAPVFGSGSLSWSALLAAALGMLALGNLVGGRVSEVFAANAFIGWILAAGATCFVVLSQTYATLVRWAAEQPLLFGELFAALALEAMPLVILGTLAPMILRSDPQEKGLWSGCVLASGSGGGIVGALAAGLLMLPCLGLARSFLVLAIVLALATLPAAALARNRTLAALATAVLLLASWYAGQSRERAIESQYGSLEVRDTTGARSLRIDGMPQTSIPATLEPGEALRRGYLLELAISNVKPGVKTALVVGLGGGLAPKLLESHSIECHTVELDPVVIDIARREFGYTGAVTQGDGRTVLSRSDRAYDLVFLDVCTADRLPSHLFTIEAMQVVQQRLSPNGVLAIQFIGDDGPWSASLLRTAQNVFGPDHALMAVARAEPRPVGPRWLFATQSGSSHLNELHNRSKAHSSWIVMDPQSPGQVLTDDHFAAELSWARTARLWRITCGHR